MRVGISDISGPWRSHVILSILTNVISCGSNASAAFPRCIIENSWPTVVAGPLVVPQVDRFKILNDWRATRSRPAVSISPSRLMRRRITTFPAGVVSCVSAQSLYGEADFTFITPGLTNHIRNHIFMDQRCSAAQIDEAVHAGRKVWRALNSWVPDERIAVDVHISASDWAECPLRGLTPRNW